MSRTLGPTGIDVSDIGFGCWAIGGPFTLGGRPGGYGTADDAESLAAIRRALELGVAFFDTADVYGTGHSEEILGRALAGRRDEVVLATKFGYTFDAARRAITGQDVTPAYVRRACEASLRRLRTDRIDLYQLHLGDLPVDEAVDLAGTLDGLVADGLIRSYGWSTDDAGRAAAFASATRATAIQHELNVLTDAPDMLAVCDTNSQGALGWLLARGDRTIPVPGVRTVAQAEQNAAAIQKGPLPAAAMTEIAAILAPADAPSAIL
jgi:aryl-alcohol dehydrogenase-like predicted oxidoreductase